MSLLSLQAVTLVLAGNRLLDEANWQIQPQERIALLGRNGAGKSTLLKLLLGSMSPDSGRILKISGLRVAGLSQEVPAEDKGSVYQTLLKGLGEIGEVLRQFHELSALDNLEDLALCQQTMDRLQAWDFLPKIETMATRLGLPLQDSMQSLSGGMKRRVLLGAALLAEPDLLLLDEPTNHLDIQAIEWLESYLKNFKGSVVLVTHDRQFLQQVSNKIVEIDRGKLYLHACDYPTYLERQESIRLSEDKQNQLFDKKLAKEEAWIRTGIKARRTRNEGRVRALKALREEYKARHKQLGKVKSLALDVKRSGSVVIEAKKIDYALGKKILVHHFSLLLTRKDKLGIVGPNGCGKTTLVRLLLGELQPDAGSVQQGTSLQVAYFDQLRSHLQEDKTLWFNVAEGSDYVTLDGKQKHLASYLGDFLFSPERFHQPVSSLSGGEKNRLLLAKLFAKPVNLLVMDEPTNDLDMETLELLEDMLIEYPGTLIIISHDRAFINNVVTSILVYEKEGQFNEFIGGYEDYQLQKKEEITLKTPSIKSRVSSNKLSFHEQRELSKLPLTIEQLEKTIAALQLQIAQPQFYQQENQHITKITQQLAAEEALLASAFERWEALEEKQIKN